MHLRIVCSVCLGENVASKRRSFIFEISLNHRSSSSSRLLCLYSTGLIYGEPSWKWLLLRDRIYLLSRYFFSLSTSEYRYLIVRTFLPGGRVGSRGGEWFFLLSVLNESAIRMWVYIV